MRLLPAFIQHIWVSTLFLGLVLAVVALMRARLTASARFTLALVGILKFAIPAGMLMAWTVGSFGPAPSPIFELPLQAGAAIRVAVARSTPSVWPQVIVGAWLVVSALLILRFTLTRHRLVRLALQTAQPATPREAAALTRARARVGVHRSIDVARSSVSEAPAVLRIVRPIVVLPSSGCDDLSDAELEALLCHECAHVLRNDNLIARIESFICALFWFHPLIWIAQRITVIERERACDEAVAESADERETYLAALAKFCHAAIVPRLPGVSCMATARLKERMDHMENYENLRAQAPSPRRIAAIATTALIAYTVVAGIAGGTSALAVGGAPNESAYGIKINAVREGASVELQGRVTDNKSGKVLAMPKVTFAADKEATARAGNTSDNVDVVFQIRPDAGRRFIVDVTVDKSGDALFKRTLIVTPSETVPQRQYSGAAISMNLKDADLRDVIRTFGKLSGINMTIDESITGTVSVSWTDVPWDQAFDEILRDNNLTYRLEGANMQVMKR